MGWVQELCTDSSGAMLLGLLVVPGHENSSTFASSVLPLDSAVTEARYRLFSITDLMKLSFPQDSVALPALNAALGCLCSFLFASFIFHASAFVLFAGNTSQTAQV